MTPAPRTATDRITDSVYPVELTGSARPDGTTGPACSSNNCDPPRNGIRREFQETGMKTASRTLLITGLLLGIAQAASAQTADEIVERHIAAIGGRAALTKLTSRSNTGTITLTTPVGDLTGPIEILNQRPNKERTLITLDLSSVGAGQMTVDQRFDGKTGYVIDTLQGNRDITGDQLEALKNEAFPTQLLAYKEKGLALKLGGREKVGDRDAYVLLVEPKTGPALRDVHRCRDVPSHQNGRDDRYSNDWKVRADHRSARLPGR